MNQDELLLVPPLCEGTNSGRIASISESRMSNRSAHRRAVSGGLHEDRMNQLNQLKRRVRITEIEVI